MTHIKTILPDQAEGLVKEIYDSALEKNGTISHYQQMLSLRPQVIGAYADLVKSFRGKIRLRRYELIMMAAARAIGCRYCLVAHGAILLENGFTVEQVSAIIRDYHQLDTLTAQEIAVMEFAEKLSLNPAQMTAADFDILRGHGLSDEEILDIGLAAAARNFQSRLIAAFGVQHEDDEAQLVEQLKPALDALAAATKIREI